MSRIEMWFDGGGGLGFGNIRRSVSLGTFLSDRGHEVRYVALSDAARALCPAACSESAEPHLVVLDAPYAGDTLVRRVRAAGGRLAALDFDGTECPDLVISLQDVRRVPAGVRFCCGLEYAIIREEIRVLGTHHPGSAEVLVLVGGGDTDGLAAQIVERLSPGPVCVIQGPAGDALRINRPGLRVEVAPPELPALMAGCSWAVTTGGTSMLELLCLGKAVHAVARTPAEEAFAGRLATQGVLLGTGLEAVGRHVPERIAECELRGPLMVDGRGCERIALELEGIL